MSPRVRALLLSAPAMLVAGSSLLVFAYQWRRPADAVYARYRAAAEAALKQQDAAAADVYLQKLLQLRPNDPEVRYLSAAVAGLAGDRQRATKTLEELAPTDRVGYAQAHYVRANQLAQQPGPWNAQQLRELAHHVSAALAAPNLEPEAVEQLKTISLLADIDQLATSGSAEDFGRALGLMQVVLEAQPQNDSVLERLAALSGLKSAESAASSTQLKDALASGNAPALAHMILGAQAALRDDHERSALHRHAAEQNNPRLAGALRSLMQRVEEEIGNHGRH